MTANAYPLPSNFRRNASDIGGCAGVNGGWPVWASTQPQAGRGVSIGVTWQDDAEEQDLGARTLALPERLGGINGGF